MTSFSETADALLANGYSIIPIIPGEKRPGTYAGSTWYGMKDWTRFCDKVVTKFELDLWKQWPEPSICVALGRASNLTAIDYDYGEGEMQRELEALLPISPVQKKGAKGRTDFFRAFSHASKKHLLDGVSVVELLAHGKQTVLPPSRHPDGMNYHWLTEKTLLNTTVDELPVIPADYHIRVIEIIAKYQKTVPKAEYVKSDRQLKGEMDPDSYWFKLNRFALDNLAIWVPKLDPSAGRGAGGGYRLVPHWRGVEKQTEKVGVNPSGIKDFATNETMSPIDLVIRVTQSDLDPAVRWLSNALGIEQEPSYFDNSPVVGPVRAELTVVPSLTIPPVKCEELNGSKGPDLLILTPKAPRDLSNAPWRRKSVAAPPQHPLGGSLPVPRGALGMLARHITATAYRPQPILDLGASLCALGTLAGRKYKFDNLRTNMYVVGLADSGAGKEHARTVIDSMFANDLGVGDRLGGAKIASGAGLLTAVRRSPSILFQLDEFGAILHGIADREKSPRHLSEILIHMTQLFTSADKTYRGVEFADQKSRPREEIIEPCMSIYGTTVPSNFWKALESNNSVDGSLARFLVLESAFNYPDGQIKPKVEPPAELIDLCKRIVGDVQNDFRLDARHPPAQTEVVCSPDAAVIINAAAAWETEQLRILEGTPFTSFYARRSELAKKIAMIHAIGLNPEDPVVSVEDITLGLAVADKSIALMVSGVKRFVSDNTSESYAKRVIEIIRAKGAPMSRSELYAKTLFLGRDRDSTMKALVNSDQIVEDFIASTGGAPKLMYKLREA